MIVKLLTEHHLEFLSLKGGCRGSSESTHVKIPYFWKSHATALIYSPVLEIVILPLAAVTAQRILHLVAVSPELGRSCTYMKNGSR